MVLQPEKIEKKLRKNKKSWSNSGFFHFFGKYLSLTANFSKYRTIYI